MELYEENDTKINNYRHKTIWTRLHRHISRLRSQGMVCRTHRDRERQGRPHKGTRDSTVQNIKSCINVQQVF